MKRYIGILALILISSLLYLGCEREDPLLKAAREYLNSQELFGVYQDQDPLFVYNAEIHQLADNTQAYSFRIQTDSQNKILQMSLDKDPELGKKCVMTVVVKGLSGIENSYTVEVVKMDESKQTLWLLDPTTKTGFVMYYRF